jgi:hypothetical protein
LGYSTMRGGVEVVKSILEIDTSIALIENI